jgi:uncharacterized protein (DUF362 family)
MPLSRRRFLSLPALAAIPQPDQRSVVAVVQGEDRRKNVHDALVAIDDQIRLGLRTRRYVVIKPNNVSTKNQLASTHLDALRGILDYLAPRFKGSVVVAESSAGETLEGFETFLYNRLLGEYRAQRVTLVDLNQEGRCETLSLIDFDLHVQPVRLAARLLDPEAFVISCGILKTHNTVIATLSVKNMVLGAPLHQPPKSAERWSDKRRYHVGLRQTHYNMFLTAQKLAPHWGVAVLDGYEGMEGNGPVGGTAVPHRVALASTDFLAADRVGLELMGINPDWIGYLTYCGQAGLGQYNLERIEVRGPAPAAARRSYRLHSDFERELKWMGPMTELPPRLG